MNEASSVRNKKDPMILLYKLSFLSCVDIIFIKKEARETYCILKGLFLFFKGQAFSLCPSHDHEFATCCF